MPLYRYKAKTMEGKICRGRMEAPTDRELFKRLEGQGLYCLAWQEEGPDVFQGRTLRAGSLVPFCRQMSAMLGAGVPLPEILEVSSRMAADGRQKEILLQIKDAVYRGLTLSEAMEGSGAFPPLLVHMVRAGEAGGGLDGIFQRMAEYYERQHELRGKLCTAMIYPLILLIVTALVSLFLAVEVLPQFASLLEGQPLPWITRLLLGAGRYLKEGGIGYLLAALPAAVMAVGIFRIPSVRLAADRLLLCIPIIGKLLKTIDAFRFAQTFAMLYGKGADVLESLELTGQVMGNSFIRKSVENVEEELKRGRLLSQALKEADVFPPVLAAMAAAGEESGCLEQMLEKAGTYYEKEGEEAVNRIAALFEPAVILVMAFVVGSVVLSVMLPAAGVYSSML